MAKRDFNSISYILKHYNSPKGQADLIDDSNIRTSLKEASNFLAEILQRKVQDYYNSYTPTVYERTFNFLNSIRISPIRREGTLYTFSVYFDESMATHPSIFNGEDGFVPILLNEGWSWRNKPLSHYHLSHYEGFHFIENAIDEFNSRNKWGITLKKEGVYKGTPI